MAPWVLLVTAIGLLAGATSMAAPAETAFREAVPGISHAQDRIPNGPLSIQIVRIERSRANLAFQPMLGNGNRIGLNTLSTQLRYVPRALGKPVAAINGDFYKTEGEPFPGDPRGLFISRGELHSAPSGRAVFWFETNGLPRMGDIDAAFDVIWPDGQTSTLGLNETDTEAPAVLFTASAGTLRMDRRGVVLVLAAAGKDPLTPPQIGSTMEVRVAETRPTSASIAPDQPWLWVSPEVRSVRGIKPEARLKLRFASTPALSGIQTAIGGGPILVHGGKVQRVTTNKAGERHPRSALGWNDTHYFLVTVDGRQPQLSIGVTLPELATYMRQLGCTDAMNLDGGGSTELWLNGRIMNRPCYGHERETATSLVVVQRAETAADAGAARTPATTVREN